MKEIVGIDESGRGAAIGPIITSALVVPNAKLQDLRDHLDGRDSKELHAVRRLRLAEKIQDQFDVQVHHEVTPPLEFRSYEVTSSEACRENVLSLVRSLQADRFEVDQVSPDGMGGSDLQDEIEAYRKRNSLRFSHQVVAQADKSCPAVTGASIFAAAERSNRIDDIKDELEKEGVKKDFGTGYPSDERTEQFLKEYLDDARVQPYLRVGVLGGRHV